MVTSFADGTKISFEQAIVANATGMAIARRGLLALDHRGHVDELTTRYDPAMLRAKGGIVEHGVGARPAPGVFVLAAHDDARQRHDLHQYTLGEGPLCSFCTPCHLCHVEVPLSVARVVLCGDAVLQPAGAPRVDVVATAKTDLPAGTVLDGIGGFHAYGRCETHAATRAGDLLPMGLAAGCRLLRAIPRDHVLTRADVALPPGRLADRLRAEQDALFAPGA